MKYKCLSYIFQVRNIARMFTEDQKPGVLRVLFQPPVKTSPIELYSLSIWKSLCSLSNLHVPCLKTSIPAYHFLDVTLGLK